MSVVLRDLSYDLAAEIPGWLADDHEGTARLGFYGRHPAWWNLVVRDPDRHGFIAWVGESPGGFVDLELDGDDAFVAVFVRAELRGRHVGRRVLVLAADEARRFGARVLAGDLESDNVASVRCCAAAGFDVDAIPSSGWIQASRAL